MIQPTLPIAGRSPMARHCSYFGAVRAQRTRGAKTQQYLTWLRQAGPATDMQAAEALGWPLSSICSIRNGCGDLVQADGCTQGTRKRTRWRAA